MSEFNLRDLAEIISARRNAPGDESYTRTLLDGGVKKIGRKLGEEATETIIAALEGSNEDLRNEAADLVYHLLVMLEARGVPIDDVLKELARRTAQSGLDEKAARSES